MGIDSTAAKMILLMRSTAGVNFDETLILGHQKNYIGLSLRKKLSHEFQIKSKDLLGEYADAFLNTVGIERFQILDISPYEGATVIQDLNWPVPDSLNGKFTTVIDIGTSEHVYNASQSIANIKSLCKVGGSVMILSPANNHLGHGFYQFSPELFFRSFDNESGFKIESMYLIKKNLFWNSWYELTDPKNRRRRGTIHTKRRCYLGVIATKIENMERLVNPQQSDYVSAWTGSKTTKLGEMYLSFPKTIRKFLDFTIIAILEKWRSRLKHQKFSWENGSYLARRGRD